MVPGARALFIGKGDDFLLHRMSPKKEIQNFTLVLGASISYSFLGHKM